MIISHWSTPRTDLLSVDGVMMDDGRKIDALTVEELAKLFGFLRKDEDGKPVLEPHEEAESSQS